MASVWHVLEGSPTGLEPGWYAEDEAALATLLADPTTEHALVASGAPSPLVHGQRVRVATPAQAEVLRKAAAISRLDELAIESRERDREEAHMDADGVLCGLLCDLGHGDVVTAYHRVEKWWA